MADGDFGALGQGVMQGLHLGMALQNQQWRGQQLQRENRRADERMDMRRQRFDMQQKADRMQIEKLRDERARTKELRNVNALLYLGQKVSQGNDLSPAEHKVALGAWNDVYGPEINQNLPKGAVKKQVVSFAAYPGADGAASDGQSIVPMIQTTWEDGHTTVGPLTQNRSNDPNDPVMPIPAAYIFGDLEHRKAALESLQARRIQLGDNAPLEAMQKQREARAKTQREIAKENRKFKHDVGLEAVKARFKARGNAGKFDNTAFNSGSRILKNMFTHQTDKYGNPVLGADQAGDYGKSVKILGDLIAQGVQPGAAAYQAYTQVIGQRPAMSLMDAQIEAEQELDQKVPSALGRWWDGDAWIAAPKPPSDYLGGLTEEQWKKNRVKELRSTTRAQAAQGQQPGLAAAKPVGNRRQDASAPEIPPNVVSIMPTGQPVRFPSGPLKGRTFVKNADGTVTEVGNGR